MNVNRREFIITGVAGLAVGAGCNRSSPGPQQTPPGNPPARQMRRLVIDFSGLYGFVFSGNPLALDVLLVDVQQTSLTNAAPHIARLRTERQNIHASNPTAETGTQKVPAPPSTEPGAPLFRELPFWELRGHRLSIGTPMSGPVTKVENRRDPKTHQKPGSDNRLQEDISWLPSMARIAGTGRFINPACMAPDPSTAKVGSRLHFTSGEVSARFRPPFQDVLWKIDTPSGIEPFEQAIGELRLAIPMAAETITFNLEPFAGGPSRQVVLQMNPTGDTLVELLNEPDDTKCKTTEEVRVLRHFQAFYELLAPPNTSTTGPVPVCPDATCPISCAPALSQTVYCPGTEFPPGP